MSVNATTYTRFGVGMKPVCGGAASTDRNVVVCFDAAAGKAGAYWNNEGRRRRRSYSPNSEGRNASLRDVMRRMPSASRGRDVGGAFHMTSSVKEMQPDAP